MGQHCLGARNGSSAGLIRGGVAGAWQDGLRRIGWLGKMLSRRNAPETIGRGSGWQAGRLRDRAFQVGRAEGVLDLDDFPRELVDPDHVVYLDGAVIKLLALACVAQPKGGPVD